MKNIIIIFLLILNLSLFYSSLLYSQTPVYYPGFPKIIDSIGAPLLNSSIPLITDLEKDGQKEIIFVTTRSTGYFLYVIKSNGNSLTGFPKIFNNNLITSISSGDVDGNGFLDIAIRTLTQVIVIDRFGNNLPGFPVAFSDNTWGWFDKFLSLYDLDNDGKLEIIVNKLGEICVFNFDGSVRTGWPKQIVGKAGINPAIGDIDNDGLAEIIIATYKHLPQGGTDSSALRIFRSNGSNFSNNWPIYYDSNYYNWAASPTLFLDKNNPAGTFILINQHGERIGEYIRSRNMKYDIYGNVLNQNNVINLDNPPGSLVIGDMNRDGSTEAVNAAGDYYLDSSVFLYNNNLQILNNWPQLGGNGRHTATPIIGKFTFGSNLNILANTWSATVDTGGFIFGYNYDGSHLPWSPLRPTGLVLAISTSDLNNDGSTELIAISSKTSNETYLHIWTFPGVSYSNEDFPWPQYGHDRYRTNQYGFIPPDDPIGIQPISANVPVKFTLYQNYPNPFNPVTNIRFDISSKSNVKLVVYDVLGREVTNLLNEEVSAGEYRVSLDASMYSSGVYFYRLIAGNYNKTMKMIILK